MARCLVELFFRHIIRPSHVDPERSADDQRRHDRGAEAELEPAARHGLPFEPPGHSRFANTWTAVRVHDRPYSNSLGIFCEIDMVHEFCHECAPDALPFMYDWKC